jgi:glycosyltransferase involved in cell wall biosynthesis
MNKLSITVFIPTYNRLALLKRSVYSVLNCGIPVHLLILDNHSTDGTFEWVQSYSKTSTIPIHVIRNPKNIGVALNFSLGFSAVETDFLVPLADDDELVPGFLSKAIDAFKLYPEAIAIIGARAFRKKNSYSPEWISARSIGLQESHFHIRQFLQYGHYTTWSAILWRTDPIKKNSIFNKSLEFGLPADIYFQFKLFLLGKVFILPLPAATFSFSKNQASSQIGLEAQSILDYGHLANRMVEELLLEKFCTTREEAKNLVSHSVLGWASFIKFNREYAISCGQRLDTNPCLIAYVNTFYEYIGYKSFPFLKELVIDNKEYVQKRNYFSEVIRRVYSWVR